MEFTAEGKYKKICYGELTMNQSITSLAEGPQDERPTDLQEFVREAAKAGEAPVNTTQANLSEAQKLIEESGLEGGQEVTELQALANRALEARNAFESRVERISSPYVISPELQKTLRIARLLKKPLLLEGEPGTGKTSLAYALAGEEDLPVIHCRGKSTLTAQSVMYEIDYVARLNDATLSQAVPEALKSQTEKWRQYLESGGDPSSQEFQAFVGSFENASKLLNMGKVSDVRNYITYGELGEAIIRAAKGEKVILLFDEIDKAKREFPNDLLDEFEHMTMRIRETGEEVSAPRENVVVLITSNHERDLPEPFLRRCIYSYIEFPKPDLMTEIVKAHIPDIDERLLESTIEAFYKVRNIRGIQKAPSTSEMLDWIRVLAEFGIKEVTGGIPLSEALLKTKEDKDIVEQVLGNGSGRAKEEILRKKRMPGEVIAVLRGQRVFTLKELPNYANIAGDKMVDTLYLTLANAGLSFQTTRSIDDRFDIYESGIKRVGSGFAITSAEGLYVYQVLKDAGFIETRYVATKEAISFTEIEEANDQFIVGTDSKGRRIYRTKDGVCVYQVDQSIPESESEDTLSQSEEDFYKALEKAEQGGQKKIRI
jgi:MoxR-like ATPase